MNRTYRQMKDVTNTAKSSLMNAKKKLIPLEEVSKSNKSFFLGKI
jgi:hypothetical protein